MSLAPDPHPSRPEPVDGLNLDGWRGGLRRTLVRFLGQGPRRLGSVRAFHTPLLHEAGDRFLAPSAGPVQPDWPSRAASWPLAPQTAPDRELYLAAESGLYDDDGAVYDLRSRTAFAETLDYWRRPPARHPSLALPRVSPARRLEGLSLFLGGLGGQTFYHFLIDHLPRLALLRPLFPEARRLIVQGHIEDNKLAWLRHVGCPLPVEWLRPLDHLHCERLAFTSRVTLPWHPTPWALERLREIAGAIDAPVPARRRFIWADRRTATARYVPWERELVESLPAPWELVDFSAHPPAAVVRIMSECAGFAGLHGAAFANVAFAPPGAIVAELFTAPNHAWYPTLSLLRGHDHHVLFAEDRESVPRLRSALAGLASGSTSRT